MKRSLLFLIVLSIFATGSLFAADATVTFVKGKVEINRNGEWLPLEVGDVVHQKEVISTGFQSEAKLKYNGNYMALSALTRASIDEMSSSGNSEKVSVALTTGALRSKVTHPEGTRVNYEVKSPVAVASVRGTDFVSMAGGKHICYDGVVAVRAARNLIPVVSETIAPEEMEEEAEESELPGEYGNQEAADTSSDNKSVTGTVVITARQKTEFNTSGNPEKPIDTASKTINSTSKAIQTAAETEAVGAGGSTTALGGSEKSADVTSLIITVDFAD